MSFIEDLKSYLLKLHEPAVSGPSSVAPVSLSPEWVRAELIQLLERLESQSPEPLSEAELKMRFEKWTAGDRAVNFATTLSKLLQSSFLNGTRREELEQYVRLAMAQRLGLPERAPSLIRGLELKRLSDIAWETVQPQWPSVETDWDELSIYALEIRATRRTDERVELTPISNVLLSLTGRDAILWLLHVEVAQSLGPADRWRLSHETVRALLENPRKIATQWVWGTEYMDFPHSWITLRRLQAFGLLKVIDSEPPSWLSGYELLNEGKRALEALVSPNGSPFSVLAALPTRCLLAPWMRGGGAGPGPGSG